MKADLKPAVRYPKEFWVKLLHGKRSYRGTMKINNSSSSSSSNRGNPGNTNSLLRKLGTCENSCSRKVLFYFNFAIRQTWISGQIQNQALLSANSVDLISCSCQLALHFAGRSDTEVSRHPEGEHYLTKEMLC